MKYPVFILSKGRADKQYATTISLLEASNIPYTVFVEPQELELYKKAFPLAEGFVTLKEGTTGEANVRQSILEYAREQKIPAYWQLDDNIRAFNRVDNRRVGKVTAKEVLMAIEGLFDRYERIGMASADHQQVAWAQVKPFTFNRGTWCCVLTSTEAPINYDLTLPMRCDVDIVLQVLTSGWHTIVSHKWCMTKPSAGKSPVGGLHDVYRDGRHNQGAIMVAKKWGKYVQLKERDAGMLNSAIVWKELKVSQPVLKN